MSDEYIKNYVKKKIREVYELLEEIEELIEDIEDNEEYSGHPD